MHATFINKIKPSAYVIPSVRETKFCDIIQEEEQILIMEFNLCKYQLTY